MDEEDPSGGDPGGTWSTASKVGQTTSIDPHAYTCVANVYGDDDSAQLTNLTLYRWKPPVTAGDFHLNIARQTATDGDCNDGRDLDNDGLIDCADGDCWLDAWCAEACDNDIDDNGDG
ncbi:MAG: hypothetical protein KTR31_12755, partial [Myxococcales bacterium]|nr:hypothetical protein [Myxococcales bacterium]